MPEIMTILRGKIRSSVSTEFLSICADTENDYSTIGEVKSIRYLDKKDAG